MNYFVDRVGPGLVCRVIPNEIPDPDKLGLPDPVKRLAGLSKGLVLVTGPTGSGKSTTLAAIIDLANRQRDDHILTIEDPIEFVHPRKRCLVNQREVGTHTESFKSGLRAALREDPDIVLVGEMRDLETIAIALETAITGHLVFGTLHTSSAIGTVDRIVDQFPADRQQQIRVMLADSLKCVVSQTLLKRIGGRPHRGPGDPLHHPRHRQPHPRRQELPDPQRHADGPGLWPEAHERRPGGADPGQPDRAQGRLHEVPGQGVLHERPQAGRDRLGPAGP